VHLLGPALITPHPFLAMHAPDGLFSMSVNVVFAVLVVAILALAGRSLARRQDHRLAPTMGVMAAFVFAAQMVNFPVASGTTGHLLGGTLAAILLGPWAGTMVMAAVIVFQALLGDGGVTVLGPNIFNMGVVGTCLAYFVYRAIVGNAAGSPARVVGAGFFAAWLAVVLASVFASLQLAVSGTAALHRALAAMVGTHMLIGIGEALITAAVVAFVLKTRPELLYDQPGGRTTPPRRGFILAGLAGSLVVAAFFSLLPTLWDYPDGLESVGIAKGFLHEPCAKDETGRITMLPAYPLGVRLAVVDGAVTAVHQYGQQATGLNEGDVVEAIAGRPTPDLASAATALGYEANARVFSVQRGHELIVAVRRGGRRQELTIRASSAPQAGTLRPLIALLPDYAVPGIEGLLSTSLTGVLGTIVMFAASFAVGRVFTRPGRLETALREAAAGADDRARSR